MSFSRPELLSAEHDLSRFDCGKPALDNWLHRHAPANQQRGFSVVMAVHEDGRVVGYYSLAPTAVEPAIPPRRVRTGQQPNPIPCVLLGQLATDQAYAGQGLGTSLLADALRRSVTAAELIGGRALLVNAIDEDAAAFWRRRGFLPSPADPLKLFRALADIEASLRAASRA